MAQGNPLEEVPELFGEASIGMVILRLAREVYQFNETRTTPRILSPDAREPARERYLVYTLVPSHEARGRVDGVIVYALDETQQRIRDVEDERERLRMIFDNTPLALLALYDATTADLIMASPRYLTMLEQVRGIGGSSARTHTWYDATLITPVEEASLLWKTALESQASVRLPEVHYFSPEGKVETTWDYTLTPIKDMQKPGSVRFMLVSILDITKQAQVRTELERLNTAKDKFL